jgi:hypothetical protein
MADSMNPDVINAARQRITGALASTSEHSTLPDDEQDALLAQACAEACDVLGSWLESTSWARLSPAEAFGRRTVADCIADWERLRPFLPSVGEALARIAGRQGNVPGAPQVEDPATYVDKLIRNATYTARRNRRLDGQGLYQTATSRLGDLRNRACKIASDFAEDTLKRASDEHDAAKTADEARRRKERKKRARSLLLAVANVMLTIVVTTSPAAVRQNVPEWGHDVVQVLFVHQIAHTAAPTVSIAPPQVGPRLG